MRKKKQLQLAKQKEREEREGDSSERLGNFESREAKDPRHLLAIRKNRKKAKRKKVAAKKNIALVREDLKELRSEDQEEDEDAAKTQRLRYEELVHATKSSNEEGKFFTVEKIPFGTVVDRPPKLDIKRKGGKTVASKKKTAQSQPLTATSSKKRKRKEEAEAAEAEALEHQNVVANLERSIHKGKQLEAAIPNQSSNPLELMRYQAQIAYERYKKKKQDEHQELSGKRKK